MTTRSGARARPPGAGHRVPAPRRALAHGYDTGAWVAPTTPPSWLPKVQKARVAVRPGPVLPLVAFAAAVLTCLVVVWYGLQLDWPWSVLAGLVALAGFALVLRGMPVAAGLAMLAAVACWGFMARSLVPPSFDDVGGVARLIVGNLAFAVPLVVGFVAGVAADSRRTARAAVTAALAGQRWFGVNRGEPEPSLPGLERIPSARFFALPAGRCSHLVAAGRQVALVATTVWPRGEYRVERHEIVRNDHPYTAGTDDVDGVVDELREWAAKLAPAGAECRAYLVVHPASERLSDGVHISMPLLEGVQVVGAGEFVEVAGGYLVPGARTVHVEVMEALAELYRTPDDGSATQREISRGGAR